MSDDAIAISDLSFRWPGSQTSLQIKQWRLAAGRRCYLHGPSGSGKTTLLNLLCGLLLPEAGEIRIAGQCLNRMRAQQRDVFRADHIGVIFQQFNLLAHLTVRENITLPLTFSPARRARAEKNGSRVEALLKALELPVSIADSPVSALSTGQQQRIAVARALIGDPALIIADEPTSALDDDARERFLALLFAQVEASGSSLLFVSHDRRLRPHFDEVVALADLREGA
ncbi:ATP-binding cassette domain-containing protein [Granulosicoccaceae sp. 1_MG-2023]|nr:ATP-binding cassette domain-containing protein [Granulosicoccaceae sp. 1_MG-2023]